MLLHDCHLRACSPPTYEFTRCRPQDQDEQIRLEMRHREEEDALYRQFAKKRAEEESCISQQIQEEWELELERLTSRFQQELGTKKSRKIISSDEERALTVKLQHEKADLEKNMTIKLDRKKGSITKKLLEQERQATAELVDKHSREMIHLINEKLEQFKQVSGASSAIRFPDRGLAKEREQRLRMIIMSINLSSDMQSRQTTR